MRNEIEAEGDGEEQMEVHTLLARKKRWCGRRVQGGSGRTFFGYFFTWKHIPNTLSIVRSVANRSVTSLMHRDSSKSRMLTN